LRENLVQFTLTQQQPSHCDWLAIPFVLLLFVIVVVFVAVVVVRQVFDEYASQEEVYKEVFAGIPEKLLEGINCTVFAYGQTGTGKTHTMLGAGQGTELMFRARGGGGGDETTTTTMGGGGDDRTEKSSSSNRSLAGTVASTAASSTATGGGGGGSASGGGTEGGGGHSASAAASLLDPAITEGMIPRVVANLFELLLLPGSMKRAVVSDADDGGGDDDDDNDDDAYHSQDPNHDFYKDHVEYTVRCSFVEVYLERIRDLIQPSRNNNSSSSQGKMRIGPDETGEMCVLGATELTCVDPEDIYSLVARGSAFRTQSGTVENSDSSRSHAIVTIRIDQVNKHSGRYRSSRLQLLDLAGSEFSERRPNAHHRSKKMDIKSAVAHEANMINQSLACVCGMVRATLAEQQQQQNQGGSSSSSRIAGGRQQPRPTAQRKSSASYAKATNIAKLLQPCLGGNSFTTVILTASPASHNIGHTMTTLNFGALVQNLVNTPRSYVSRTATEYVTHWTKAQRRGDHLTALIRLLVKEFASLRGKVNVRNPRTWVIVEEVAKQMRDIPDHEELDLVVTVNNHNKKNNSSGRSGSNSSSSNKTRNAVDELTEKEERIAALEAQLKQQKLECEQAKAAQRAMQSERTEFKAQVEFLSKENQTLKQIIKDCQSENRLLTTRKSAVEHNLRTSQFRENEATTFLRQFRSFYIRLLKNKASQGSGDTRQITEDLHRKFPGVPELADLINIDKLMMTSGLIEEHEVGEDTNSPEYFPTKAALSKSAVEAESAEQKEQELLLAELGHSSLSSDKMRDNGMLSVVHRQETAQFVEHRQRLLKTPAGIASMVKEKELENELLELSKKCINLQNSLGAERGMLEALSVGRHGAIAKLKSATEMNLLQQELERKTNDLQAIIWTMNELHLVNKAVDEKAQNREQHIAYLEDLLVDYQARSGKLVMETQTAERKMKEEAAYLRKQLDGLTVSLWQLGDPIIEEQRPSPCRLIVPFQSLPEEEDEEEPLDEMQRSVGSLEDDLDAPDFRAFVRMVTTTAHVEDAPEG
jgi:kinesin family member 5